MPNTYAGNAENFAEADTLPSDADGPHVKAADVNSPLSGNADRSLYLRLRMLVNWPYIAETDLTTGDAVWSDKEQAWYCNAGIGAAVNDWAVSYDYGKNTWVQSGFPAAADIIASAIAASGDFITIGITRGVYKFTYSTYGNITVVPPALGSNNLSVAPSGGDCAYEPTATKWIAVYRNGASGHKAEYDADGTGAWSVATLPAAWTGYTGSNDPRVAAIAGHAIACFIDATPKVNFIRSTDGGATWSTNVQVTPTGFTPTLISRPVYDSYHNEWYVMLGATGHTEIIKSTDHGQTWSSVYTSTAFFGHDLAGNTRVLAMIGVDGRIFYSIDQGASWKFYERLVYVTPATRWIIRAGGGGFCVLNDAEGNTHTTLRLGTGATP